MSGTGNWNWITVAAGVLTAMLAGVPLGAQTPLLLNNAKPAVVRFEVLDRYGALLREASGCIVTPEGVVVTSYGAIRGGYSAAVYVSGHSSPSLQGVIAVDPAHDLAVLKLSDPSVLTTALLGDATKVAAGAEVFILHAHPNLGAAVIAARVRATAGGTSSGGFTLQASPGSLAAGDPIFDAGGHLLAVLGQASGPSTWSTVPINLARPALAQGVTQTLRQVTEAHTRETRLLETTRVVPARQLRTTTLPLAANLLGGDLELSFTARGGMTGNIRLRLRLGGRLLYDSRRIASGSFHATLAEIAPLSVEWDNRGSILLPRRVTTRIVVRQLE